MSETTKSATHSKAQRTPNRLISSSSPYLLQHALNPVDWYPWGEEALKKAEAEDKPILVSIGYSACHWCHVMEHQSFEHDEIAAVMNEHFICIKVDREERPDVDAIYMDAVQHMGVQGGWPLNVFLMPNREPFYGGTYFQPQQWMHLLKQIGGAFKEHRGELAKSASQFAASLRRSEEERYRLSEADMPPADSASLAKLYDNLATRFDAKWGGLDRSPKFPMPCLWSWLLHYAHAADNGAGLKQLHTTLWRIARGGIYDQAGGGWARYSVDAEWFAPHFEKMLYDNGQLLSLYAQAYQQKQDPEYVHAIAGTLRWLEQDMRHSSGLFYSAEDADSEGVEGKFYIWTWAEFNAAIGADAELAATYYSLEPFGNWEHASSILFPKTDDKLFAERYDLTLEQLYAKRKHWEASLLQARTSRIRPGLDDKVLCSWNALAIIGLVQVAKVFSNLALQQETPYGHLADLAVQAKELALAAGEALRKQLWNEEAGELAHTWKNGVATGPAFLDDYALASLAALELYNLDWNASWITWAQSLHVKAQELFRDHDSPLYFYTADGMMDLIARKKELFDNVIPSSNALMAQATWKLGQFLADDALTAQAKSMVGKMLKVINTDVQYSATWAWLWMMMSRPGAEVVVTGPDAVSIAEALWTRSAPHTIVLAENSNVSTTLAPHFEGRTGGGQARIYVCENRTCHLPVSTLVQAEAQGDWMLQV